MQKLIRKFAQIMPSEHIKKAVLVPEELLVENSSVIRLWRVLNEIAKNDEPLPSGEELLTLCNIHSKHTLQKAFTTLEQRGYLRLNKQHNKKCRRRIVMKPLTIAQYLVPGKATELVELSELERVRSKSKYFRNIPSAVLRVWSNNATDDDIIIAIKEVDAYSKKPLSVMRLFIARFTPDGKLKPDRKFQLNRVNREVISELEIPDDVQIRPTKEYPAKRIDEACVELARRSHIARGELPPYLKQHAAIERDPEFTHRVRLSSLWTLERWKPGYWKLCPVDVRARYRIEYYGT